MILPFGLGYLFMDKGEISDNVDCVLMGLVKYVGASKIGYVRVSVAIYSGPNNRAMFGRVH